MGAGERVFYEALLLPAPERELFLAVAGAAEAEVRSLLAAHEQASGFLDDPAVDPRPMMENFAGRWIGHYLLERQLGEGGWGLCTWPIERWTGMRCRWQ